MNLSSLLRFFRRSAPAITPEALPQSARVHEYIYVDQQRLDAYLEQVHAPVTYDKVPLWSVELSGVGPKASGQQARPSRLLTNTEKLRIVLEYLRSTKEFALGRPADPVIYVTRPVFRLETCEATCIYLPPRTGTDPETRGFRLWLSEAPSELPTNPVKTFRGQLAFPGRLFLLEDDPYEDEPMPSYLSTYSTFRLLSEVFTTRLLWTPPEVNSAGSAFDAAFARDPIATLKQLGAKTLTKRWITTLYRIRTGTEMIADEHMTYVVTFGYPIIILDGNVDL